eukprot:scaffold72530_cov64-Phaeocystis_antarctica.AAC.4
MHDHARRIRRPRRRMSWASRSCTVPAMRAAAQFCIWKRYDESKLYSKQLKQGGSRLRCSAWF